MNLRRCFVATVLTVGAVVLLLGPRATSSQAPDPVTLSPNRYKVRLENKYVRVLESHSRPGEKEPMHSHPPGVVYFLTDYKNRSTDQNGHVSENNRKAGDIIWRDQTTHAVEDVGTEESRLLTIELKIPLP